MEATKPCDACRTNIDARATRCPHCRARQMGSTPLHRGGPRLIAGVCGALAGQLGLDPLLVRLAFALMLTASGGIVVWAYLVLWATLPAGEHQRAPLGRLIDYLNAAFSPRREAPMSEPSMPANPGV